MVEKEEGEISSRASIDAVAAAAVKKDEVVTVTTQVKTESEARESE